MNTVMVRVVKAGTIKKRKMMKKPTRVHSVDHLKALIAKGEKRYFMVLAGRVCSRKTIRYDTQTDTFSITHHIDGTREKVSGKAFRRSLIREAIQRGAFFTE